MKKFSNISKKKLFIFIIVVVVIVGFIVLCCLRISNQNSIFYRNAQKSFSMLNQATQHGNTTFVAVPKKFSNGEELAKYFSNGMAVPNNGKKIILENGVVYQFEASGDCFDKKCFVIIDLNGTKQKPNKYWKVSSKPSDRIVMYIGRIKNKQSDKLQVIKPQQIQQGVKIGIRTRNK